MNLIETVLKLDAEATNGPWKNGRPPDAVIHEEPSAEPWGDDTHDYYGGVLIAESIAAKNKALITAYRTAAPKLARALKVAILRLVDLDLVFCLDGEFGTPIKDTLLEIEKELSTNV